MTFTTNGPGEVTLGAGDRAAATAEIKRTLAIVTSDDDTLIAAFAETALGLAESFLGRVLIQRAMTERLAASACWQSLGAAPVAAIDTVYGLVDGVAAPLAVDDYAVDIDADATGWVRTTGLASGLIEVGYTAGWVGDWASIPAPVRQGAVLLAAHLYGQRDASVPPPAAVTALWRPYRAVALARAVRA